TTRVALHRLSAGTPPLEAGSAEENAQGNGSLMRVLPLALWHRGSDAELVADARAQSRVTHGHICVQMCCALYCVWARGALRDQREPWEAAVRTLRGMFGPETPERAALDGKIRPDGQPRGEGRGYVVDCLHSARLAQEAGDYEAIVPFAIRLGHDTDTTACVAGGIAGMRAGIAGIPARWRAGLRGKELIAPLLARLGQWVESAR
ncbi:MAG TPA: ADP-ribosylglycohydrolase family protein, partial [Ktedonobacterales bacterium]|nr:ADP-ribosylglycohydrolase family protein [Ktedonobacterales bacterium]